MEDVDNKMLTLSIEHQVIIQRSYNNEKRFFSLPLAISFDGPGWELLRLAESIIEGNEKKIWVQIRTENMNFEPIWAELQAGNKIIHITGIYNHSANKETFEVIVTVGIGSRTLGEFSTIPIYTVSKPPKAVPTNKLSQWIGTDLNRRFGLILRPKTLKKADYRAFAWYFSVNDRNIPVASPTEWSAVTLERQNGDQNNCLMNDELVRIRCKDYVSPLLKVRSFNKRSNGMVMQMDKIAFELAQPIPGHLPGQVLSSSIQTDDLRSFPFSFTDGAQNDDDYFEFQIYTVDSTDYAFVPKQEKIENAPYVDRIDNGDDILGHQFTTGLTTRRLFGKRMDSAKLLYLGEVECRITRRTSKELHFEIPNHSILINGSINRSFFADRAEDGSGHVFSLPICLIIKDGTLFWTGINLNIIVPLRQPNIFV
ncbi:unnamed protein product [Bursaphelenchus xylophilus]|uniref:(pine wood nematode) hypothetical protein n=1 Tax=Bursaphelenchus xylophilus TaxID=6326 RepID=A0A1I7RT72_BURXY|nr:unnamed protein product [Bursaphelenchus xylophilus]CAG9122564.1 unnamed protein product [Bursaphelenchus xylophilus]